MQDKIYFAVRCRNCEKTSAVSFGRDDLTRMLDDRLPIELSCAFDGHQWNATAQERVALVKMLEETAGNIFMPLRTGARPLSPSRH